MNQASVLARALADFKGMKLLTPKRNIRWWERRDKWRAALHEAGHFCVLTHYGIAAITFLVRAGEPTDECKSWVGQTAYSLDAKLSKFKKAVMAWHNFEPVKRPALFLL